MSSQIEAEQKADDENYSQLSQTCDTSLSSLANDIIEAQNSIKNSQIELNTVEKLLTLLLKEQTLYFFPWHCCSPPKISSL